MTTNTKTQLIVAAVSLSVAAVGFFSLHMADAKDGTLASLQEQKARVQQERVEYKPIYAQRAENLKKADAEMQEANTKSAQFKEQEDALEAQIQEFLNGDTKK